MSHECDIGVIRDAADIEAFVQAVRDLKPTEALGPGLADRKILDYWATRDETIGRNAAAKLALMRTSGWRMSETEKHNLVVDIAVAAEFYEIQAAAALLACIQQNEEKNWHEPAH